MKAASISIVIPTRDRPGALDICLGALAEQTLPRDQFEVIVVDDGGVVELGDIVDRHRGPLRILLNRRAHAGPAAARNAGAEAARGEVLAFTDDDCLPEADWLATITAAVERSAESMVGGRTVNALVSNRCSEASQSVITHMYEDGLRRTGELPFVTSNNLALDHELFDTLGGFDASFPEAAAEDRDLSARCTASGGSLVYEPAALVRHAHPLDARSLLRQYVAYGRGARLLSRTRPDGHAAPGTRSPSFYGGMLAEPFHRHALGDAVAVASLVALTQIGTAIGYLSRNGPQSAADPGRKPSPEQDVQQGK